MKTLENDLDEQQSAVQVRETIAPMRTPDMTARRIPTILNWGGSLIDFAAVVVAEATAEIVEELMVLVQEAKPTGPGALSKAVMGWKEAKIRLGAAFQSPTEPKKTRINLF